MNLVLRSSFIPLRLTSNFTYSNIHSTCTYPAPIRNWIHLATAAAYYPTSNSRIPPTIFSGSVALWHAFKISKNLSHFLPPLLLSGHLENTNPLPSLENAIYTRKFRVMRACIEKLSMCVRRRHSLVHDAPGGEAGQRLGVLRLELRRILGRRAAPWPRPPHRRQIRPG